MASEDDERINHTISSIMGTLIGIILICSVMVPIVSNQLNALDATTLNSSLTGLNSLIVVVVTITIVGLIISSIRGLSTHGER